MDKLICDGTRNSKWYYDGVNYIRKMQTRDGIKTRIYSKEDIKVLPDNKDTLPLKKHLNNIS